MTMVPTENYLPKQHHHHHLPHGGGFYGYCGSSYGESFGLMNRVHGYDFHTETGSDLVANNRMAEDESRTNSLNEAAASNSKDNNNNQEQEQERDEGWLQLSIGAQAQATRHELDPTARTGGLIELDLLPGGNSHSHSQQASRPLGLGPPMFHHMPEFPFRPPQQRPQLMHSFSTPLFFQQQQQQQGGGISSFPYYGELSSSFRPIPQNMAPPPSASSSSSFVPLGSYFARPFPVQPDMDVAGPSSDFRIIDPPKRPHSGIWFVLQASHNQAKEPFLPQIPKSYLRIKDGKMTVRLLMKYVVDKLRLDSESEVEITCRGQQLLPHLTLLQVRDQIWSSGDAVTLLPHTSSTPHHLMLPHTSSTPHHLMLPHTSSTPHHLMLPHTSSTPHHLMLPHTSSTPHHLMLPHTSTLDHLMFLHYGRSPN